MRSFLTILFAFSLFGYLASFFVEPGQDISTIGWIVFMSLGILYLFLVAFVLGAKPPKE